MNIESRKQSYDCHNVTMGVLNKRLFSSDITTMARFQTVECFTPFSCSVMFKNLKMYFFNWAMVNAIGKLIFI